MCFIRIRGSQGLHHSQILFVMLQQHKGFEIPGVLFDWCYFEPTEFLAFLHKIIVSVLGAECCWLCHCGRSPMGVPLKVKNC